MDLLKWGRRFQVNAASKIIVGRDQRDNEALEVLVRPGDVVLTAETYPGPLVVIPQARADTDLTMALSLCASYSGAPEGEMVAIRVEGSPGDEVRFSRRGPRERFQELLV